MASGSKTVFGGDKDHYNGILLKPQHYGRSISPDEFQCRLSASLEAWQTEGRRGIWIRIPLSQAELVPVAAKEGFQFHHAHPDHVMMVRWLPTDQPNTLPTFATHYIGVAGFVVNEKNEVLLIQERWIRNLKIVHWKLPGGHAETGEDLAQTAVRETFEETGIRTEFVAVLCFRHMRSYRWGTDDLYFACLLHPLNTDIKINPTEIADAKWMDVDAYLADPATMDTNKMIGQAYLEGLKRGTFIQPTVYPNFLQNKPPLIMYRPQPMAANSEESCDPQQEKDQKSHDETCDSQEKEEKSHDRPTAKSGQDTNAHL